MWKKEESFEPTEPRRPEAPLSTEQVPQAKATGERATIGRSISIKGEVTGDEDLLIQGSVDGSVTLKQHAVTVGPEGEVKADIAARVITVEGTVEGNLNAQEQVVLRGSARVQGNITSPRVVLEGGARFRGGVDMGETPAAATAEKTAPGAARTAPGSVKLSTEPTAIRNERETSSPSGTRDATAPAAASGR